MTASIVRGSVSQRLPSGAAGRWCRKPSAWGHEQLLAVHHGANGPYTHPASGSHHSPSGKATRKWLTSTTIDVAFYGPLWESSQSYSPAMGPGAGHPWRLLRCLIKVHRSSSWSIRSDLVSVIILTQPSPSQYHLWFTFPSAHSIYVQYPFT